MGFLILKMNKTQLVQHIQTEGNLSQSNRVLIEGIAAVIQTRRIVVKAIFNV